jgi:hypothetical protein
MRKLLVLAIVIALSACATPEQRMEAYCTRQGAARWSPEFTACMQTQEMEATARAQRAQIMLEFLATHPLYTPAPVTFAPPPPPVYRPLSVTCSQQGRFTTCNGQ